MPRNGVDSLTEAEKKVLRLIAQHVTETKEIARLLHLSPSTVKTQVGSAMRKLDAISRHYVADAPTRLRAPALTMADVSQTVMLA